MKNENKMPVGRKRNLPSDWRVKELIAVADYVDYRGKTPTKSFRGRFLITARNVKSGYIDYEISQEYISEDSYKAVMSRGLPKIGDIIITTEAPLGSVAMIDRDDIALAQRIIKYRAKSNTVNNHYLYYYLLSEQFQQILNLKSTGSTAKGIKGSVLHKLSIEFPPLPEQQAISSILIKWDDAINKTQQLISQLQQRNKWLTQNLLGGNKRLKGFEKSKWIGVKMKEVFEKVTRRNTEVNTNVVTISAQRGFVRQIDYFTKVIASDTLDNYFLVERGEFCYNKSYANGYPWGATKRLNDFDKAVVTTLYICFKLIDTKSYSGDFFEQFFEANSLDEGLMKIAHEGGRAHGLLNVTPSDFFNLKISIPPTVAEQNQIASIITQANTELKTLEQKLLALKEQKRGLMQQLLTGKKRVAI